VSDSQTLARAIALLISLGDYTGNTDKRTGINRCAVIVAMRDLRETLEAVLYWHDRGERIHDSFWESLREHLAAPPERP
jgi:hypothetical protein